MENLEKRPFFRAAMAGLGKYHTVGFGRIGVYRVKENAKSILSLRFLQKSPACNVTKMSVKGHWC